jgi:hypothetical protein
MKAHLTAIWKSMVVLGLCLGKQQHERLFLFEESGEQLIFVIPNYTLTIPINKKLFPFAGSLTGWSNLCKTY